MMHGEVESMVFSSSQASLMCVNMFLTLEFESIRYLIFVCSESANKSVE